MAPSTRDIRRQFLDYFGKNGHEVVPSFPLVPPNDPTLMFTNAGMVQFKDVFTGKDRRPYARAASSQKCIRISGKHNDLENVGRTSRHHTFFEMLGNFSFGDYFKRDACRFGWELLTRGYGLDPNRLWVTVFAGTETIPADDEAAGIWQNDLGVSRERIFRLGLKDNFWAMGENGPCGPCSEILYDRGDRFGPADPDNGERFFELWNLVFMQFEVKEPGGPMVPLPKPCIDTGAGLERIASVLQGKDTNFDTDLLRPLVDLASEIAGKRYGSGGEDDVSMRVIADHARMAAFLIAEGVFPEKTGREYVLRRVMRRAIRHGHKLGIEDLFFHRVALRVVELMGDDYPEIRERQALVDQVCRQEEERFRVTLKRGCEILSSQTEWKVCDGKKLLSGETAFDLTATYGFPKDLIEVIGEEMGFVIDETGFCAAAECHREVSGAGKIGEEEVAPIYREIKARADVPTRFMGYSRLDAEAGILALGAGSGVTDQANEGEKVIFITDVTPFYAESGGQVGDAGLGITKEGAVVRIEDVQKPLEGLWVHHGVVEKGTIRTGCRITLRVDAERRAALRRNHTATHLLHWALRSVLGPHALQKGSRVSPESLRFDFAHAEGISRDQLREIERLAQGLVIENHPVMIEEELPVSEAKARGAVALFEEKYGDKVRLVQIAGKSLELCGGTHVSQTGDIGMIRIVSESSVAAGVRRIEALTGHAATAYTLGRDDLLHEACQLLRCAPAELVDRIGKLFEREKSLGREIEKLKGQLAMGGGKEDLLSRVREVNGVKVLGARLPVGDPVTLRETADKLKEKIRSGIICVGGEHQGKAALVVSVTPDLTDRYHAGKLIRPIAEAIGGGGGGRPDMAQAGGPRIENLDEALSRIYDEVARV